LIGMFHDRDPAVSGDWRADPPAGSDSDERRCRSEGLAVPFSSRPALGVRGLACFACLDDLPAAARWLEPAERRSDALAQRAPPRRGGPAFHAARRRSIRGVLALSLPTSGSSAALRRASATGCRRSSRGR
jgi:hypothetical protein